MLKQLITKNFGSKMVYFLLGSIPAAQDAHQAARRSCCAQEQWVISNGKHDQILQGRTDTVWKLWGKNICSRKKVVKLLQLESPGKMLTSKALNQSSWTGEHCVLPSKQRRKVRPLGILGMTASV